MPARIKEGPHTHTACYLSSLTCSGSVRPPLPLQRKGLRWRSSASRCPSPCRPPPPSPSPACRLSLAGLLACSLPCAPPHSCQGANMGSFVGPWWPLAPGGWKGALHKSTPRRIIWKMLRGKRCVAFLLRLCLVVARDCFLTM